MNRLKQVVTRLFWLAVVLYTGFSLSKAVWRNIKVNQWIGELDDKIVRIKQENEKLENLIVYYQTEQFKEIELRRRLGYKKPDEQVVVLPPTFSQGEAGEQPKKKLDRNELPYYRKWLETITGVAI